MANERLTRQTVAECALRLADSEGLEAVTIRRLAQELGVSPMAPYWHFKNKDELLLGMTDHALAPLPPIGEATDGWQRQLRGMIETVIGIMREHPSLAALLQNIDAKKAASFARATNDTLELLARAGLGLQESYWVAMQLLQGITGLIATRPEHHASVTPEQAAESRRQARLTMEALSPCEYPMVVAYARTLEEEPDPERYYAFGVDLIMGGIEAIAARYGTASP
ncbi:TetR/AcrR family transcriptional regulator [Rugosimonospora africana]|uniref:TetR family transcriptional regulator n=1 Tax=Rugosimonospora africana TaxID=556532 RepID=A0A8J3QVQ7_9ACTN|nr:TetR family transcriptional regulator [Rugosimonospora africana]GIH16982.1 TetR family transcriptional regulator [Rugosimonospora africana]